MISKTDVKNKLNVFNSDMLGSSLGSCSTDGRDDSHARGRKMEVRETWIRSAGRERWETDAWSEKGSSGGRCRRGDRQKGVAGLVKGTCGRPTYRREEREIILCFNPRHTIQFRLISY